MGNKKPSGGRVFLSYWRRDTEPLVERIERDLRAAGHDPWRDRAEIKFTDSWRQSILQGLQESRLVLAFLSPHAVAEGGVCLDELALALGTTHVPIVPLLCAPEETTRIPPSIGHIQWLDMKDWQTHWKTKTWDRWYAPKLKAILAQLADPTHQSFTGEIADLREWLDPFLHAAAIAPLIRDFEGRSWLVDRVNDWRTKDQRRIFHLTGNPGTGKSAFSAWMTHFARANVVGLNLCEFGNEHRSDARRVIRTLAFLIATRLPDYRAALIKARSRDPKGVRIEKMGALALFDALLSEPLAVLIDGGRVHDRFVLVLDALDETRDARGDSELAEVLNAKVGTLPPWMSVVATSRPEMTLSPDHGGVARVELGIGAAADPHAEDIAVYARAWFASFGETVVRRVIDRSEGNFLYLRLLRDAVRDRDNPLDPAAGDGPPRGLSDLYRRFFRRQFPDDAAYERVRPLMEVMTAASRPVPLAFLRRLFPDWQDVPTQTRILHSLGSLFRRADDALSPFHGSVRDFLADPDQSRAAFVVSVEKGRARLARALWDDFLASPGDILQDPFALAELPTVIITISLRKEMTAVALRATESAPNDWTGHAIQIANARRDAYAWDNAADWYSAIAALAGEANPSLTHIALIEQGNIMSTIGRLDNAEAAFSAAYDAARIHAERNPENLDAQRDLSVSFDKIGDVQVAKGALDDALASFRDGLAIAERLAKADPANAGWQRDLSISYEKLAGVFVKQNKLPEALKAYQDEFAIQKRLADSSPGHAGWQRTIAVTYLNLGITHVRMGDLAQARRNLTAGRAISADLVRRFPEWAQSKRDLDAFDRLLGILPP